MNITFKMLKREFFPEPQKETKEVTIKQNYYWSELLNDLRPFRQSMIKGLATGRNFPTANPSRLSDYQKYYYEMVHYAYMADCRLRLWGKSPQTTLPPPKFPSVIPAFEWHSL